ncbi:3',5'-cyclic adenosine monophosphate phosphodiesterase CpdA [Dyadobacter sp. CECT 9623]|uniref:3',5'-cyclic adenosine monophosphate phosphodiesterase CpdA n=1 Tax=Dyadobacter linearis TaxID=2823330 RepID=A0ABM8UNI9_9BACT|nr:metallophosphoesterase [Dyadobacter sp. CECT 9623]CAG5069073.1 3',5'-cyclic adenosine monophosphate phosphodiesterase CpdA [Dyadobacter sp. CECT 9623]
MKPVLRFLPFVSLLFFSSCDSLFLYNPNQVTLHNGESNLNARNVAALVSQPPPDTLRFILMGDSQRWYDESEEFVKSANKHRDISFVLHAGDISDFGLSQEFKWVNRILSKLHVPYMTVIGNHDIVANGPDAYRKMFGPMNYSFEYGSHKFIFINTNSREYAFDGTVPDVNWLRKELADNPENKDMIVIAHIPPYDNDFDKNLEKEYGELLGNNPNVHMSLYGHQHSFNDGEYYKDGVRYVVTTSMGARGYLKIKVWKGGQEVERINF